MLKYISLRISAFFSATRKLDLLDFNKFILRNIIYHIFNTRNLLPFVIALCVVGFSLITEESRYIFIPQTSVAAYASFFIFTLIVSIITLLIYPIFIIVSVNFVTSYLHGTTKVKYAIKLTTLIVSFIIGVEFFSPDYIDLLQKVQVVIIWLGLYLVLISMYLAYIKHNNPLQLSRLKLIFLFSVLILAAQPLIRIDLHTSEALNFTNINPQVYLTSPNCALLHSLTPNTEIPANNNTLNNTKYYRELSDNQGCYIYGNTIRYSFGYDYVLLVKKNIRPLVNKKNHEYNVYVRLNCFAGNCYSENNLIYPRKDDFYEELLAKGQRLYYPL